MNKFKIGDLVKFEKINYEPNILKILWIDEEASARYFETYYVCKSILMDTDLEIIAESKLKLDS